MAEFEILKNANEQYYWLLRDDKNDILAKGGLYPDKKTCINVVNLVKKIAPTTSLTDKTNY
jgi:uncharacterized protein YegP (UPF0339 family)